MSEVSPSSPARYWRFNGARYNMEGTKCEHCDYKIFPPRDVCPNCGDEANGVFVFNLEKITRVKNENSATK